MRIIYITDFYYFEACGARTSARAHLTTLQNIYGKPNVYVIALVGHKNYQYKPEHHIEHGTSRSLTLFFQCLKGYPSFLGPQNIKSVMKQIEQYNPNVIFIDNSIYGILIRSIKEKYPKVIVASYYHDVKAKLALEWKKQAMWYRKPVYQAMITNERLTAKYADINYTLNKRETDLYHNAYGKKPEAELPVYMDVQAKRYSEKENTKRKGEKLRLLFFGGYYLPNVHGIDWFIKNVFPKLSNVELYIAGRGMDKLQNQYQDKNIFIQGEIASIEELYSKADMIISPIFEGGGMKVKMAEAMAFGKIAIGSDESYEGYGQNIPKEYWNRFFFRANTVDEFVDAINKIQSFDSINTYNPEVRAIYEKHYSEQYAEKVISESINRAEATLGD